MVLGSKIIDPYWPKNGVELQGALWSEIDPEKALWEIFCWTYENAPSLISSRYLPKR